MRSVRETKIRQIRTVPVEVEITEPFGASSCCEVDSEDAIGDAMVQNRPLLLAIDRNIDRSHPGQVY